MYNRLMIEIRKNTLDTNSFIEIYSSVGWDCPNADQISRAINNTLVSFVAYDGDKPIGMIRLLGDKSMCYLIKNLAVSPNYQGKGKENKSIGKMLLEVCFEYIKENLNEGEEADVELISTLEGKNFYIRNGFQERPCSFFGPGMYMCIKK